MKNPKLIKKVEHYKAIESRKWKRVWNTCELLVLLAACALSAGVLEYYGNGKAFQPIFQLFAFLLVICIAALIPSMYRSSSNLKRWQISFIKLGFMVAAGLATLSAFLILEMQNIKDVPL